MKVALVYDRVNKWGGAERILLSLHSLFPDAPLFTAVYDRRHAPWANVFKVKTSFLQHAPFIKNHHEIFPFLMPIAFESFSFDGYDLVISITSEAAKGIITKPQTKHVCLCLTPTRYLWSGYNEYFSKTMKMLTLPIVSYLRTWDKIAAQRPDVLIAISQEVKRRIQKYYQKDAVLIYPPMTVLPKPSIVKQKDYYLVVARLSRFTRYKRVDLAVAAAKRLDLPLIVVGDGDIDLYKKDAGPQTQFVGRVTDEELAGYYANCRALIFPGCEDFGLSMVEALSFGKPVIAYKKGGALEIVEEHKTGTFFERQTVESLVAILITFNASLYNSATCKIAAQRFSEKIFLEKIKRQVKNI